MILIPAIKDQPYAVLGLGKSGMATAASLKASGAKVAVWDDNERMRANAADLGYAVVNFAETDVSRFKELVLSPGIPHSYPAPHATVKRFQDAGIPIIGDIELLFRACPKAIYVGITGTNGKSTTTALIGHLLITAGRQVQIGGNLGTPVLSFEPYDESGIYVLELSSYQLEMIETNRIQIGVLLNVTPDHLDRHGGMQGYADAKARLFQHLQQKLTLIVGNEEEATRALKKRAQATEGVTVIDLEGAPDLKNAVGPRALASLPGPHNWQNASAAFKVGLLLGVSENDIIEGLTSFAGLIHRQQFVSLIDGVRFINDSKATNADAAAKALACYDAIYWIIGGTAKEGGLAGLEVFAPRIRHAFLIGASSAAFAQWCKEEGKVPYTLCKTLDVATAAAAELAWQEALKDAVVLLSPACASWDQFNGFDERGRAFIAIVHNLTSPSAKILA